MSRINANRMTAERVLAEIVVDDDDPRLARWPDMSVQPRRRRAGKGGTANDDYAQNMLRVAEYDAFVGEPGAIHCHTPGRA